jgi:hypothetical protein
VLDEIVRASFNSVVVAVVEFGCPIFSWDHCGCEFLLPNKESVLAVYVLAEVLRQVLRPGNLDLKINALAHKVLWNIWYLVFRHL